jgi:hypothetical protein
MSTPSSDPSHESCHPERRYAHLRVSESKDLWLPLPLPLPLPVPALFPTRELSFRPERSAAQKPATHSCHVAWSAVLFLALVAPIPASAQGCAQCRDNTAATSPATQRAYRHAIILMTGAAATLFLTTLAIMKRNR